jgi:ubiquinone/menaquinone biosynthesis C-methylase UbiE
MSSSVEKFLGKLGLSDLAEISRREQQLLYDGEHAVESPFDVFIRNTTQKENTAQTLAAMMLRQEGSKQLEVLDIGTGEGIFHIKLVKHLHALGLQTPVRFHLLDPKAHYAVRLRGVATSLSEQYPSYKANVILSSWEDFMPENYEVKSFDRIVCSHTIYHFKREEFQHQFSKMTETLSPSGKLYVVARCRDEVYEFINNFYTVTTGRPFIDVTIEDAMPALQAVAREKALTLREVSSHAEVVLPFQTNPEDAQTIVGFFLRAPWKDISDTVREQIMSRFNHKDSKLHQMDCIVELSHGPGEAKGFDSH